MLTEVYLTFLAKAFAGDYGTVCPFSELGALVLSTDFQLDSGQMIGYHSSSLIFSSLAVCLRSLPR